MKGATRGLAAFSTCVFASTLVAAQSSAPSHGMQVLPEARCGGVALTGRLAEELSMRSVQVKPDSDEGDHEGWQVHVIPRTKISCDLKATRGDESFELTGLRWRNADSIRQAAIRLAWVSELTPKQREALTAQELDLAKPEDESAASGALDDTAPVEPTLKPPLRWVPFATASFDVTSMNEQVTGLWGIDLGIFSRGRWAMLVRGYGTMGSVDGNILYDNGLTIEPGTLRAYGAAAGGLFRQPFGRFGVLGQVNVGFLSSHEEPPTNVGGVVSARQTGALVEGLAGGDWAFKGFIIRLLGGYRFAGPFDNIGGKRFSFSGPVGRVSLGYRTAN